LELSWTTFVLEIINFLVLVWILKRFLYQPVLDVIARRRAEIDRQLIDAGESSARAQAVQQKYEGRLGEWERERQQAREQLRTDIEIERQARLDKLNGELEQYRQRSEVAAVQKLDDAKRKSEVEALRHGARFATRLLEQTTGPETQQKLVALLLDELAMLPQQSVTAIQHQLGADASRVTIHSAYELPIDTCHQLEQALQNTLNIKASPDYEVDPQLLAGVSIAVGDWELDANIRDELQGFAELAANE